MNPESSYSTRFFCVRFDRRGESAFVDTSAIRSVTEKEAVEYAQTALEQGKERGWIGDYRYKVYETGRGKAAVFVNGLDARTMNRVFLLSAASAFAGGFVVIVILVVLLSRRAVRPVAESYEKQKQFVTDANHALKTPLTIIRADLELAQEELGKNEWLDDMRDASDGMTALVEKLVTLARMDEEGTAPEPLPFDLSEAVQDTAEAFRAPAEARGLSLTAEIAPAVIYTGNEETLRQLVSILLENAVKYCDPGGGIAVTLHGGRHPVLTVDNSFRAVEEMALGRLFDRFYRGSGAGAGSGIGLSIAAAIVEKHHGQIEARGLEGSAIRFLVRL